MQKRTVCIDMLWTLVIYTLKIQKYGYISTFSAFYKQKLFFSTFLLSWMTNYSNIGSTTKESKKKAMGRTYQKCAFTLMTYHTVNLMIVRYSIRL